MNYEQKYNASLKQAKKELASCGSMDCDAARLIFRLFPQLRESEDERIRKHIVTFLLEADKMGDAPEEVAKWLAYLEKQKEQGKYACPEEKVEDSVEVASRMNHIRQELLPIARFILSYSHWDLDKKVWNHPVAVVPVFRVLDALAQKGKPYCCLCDEQKEQKPAEWSEEDEKNMEMYQEVMTAIIFAKNRLKELGCEGLSERMTNAFEWLKTKFKSK